MGWVKTREIPEDTKAPEPFTVSVNKWSGLRINMAVYKAMGSPRWVEVEFDQETSTLRFKPGENIITDEVINQIVKLPTAVRAIMSRYDKRVAATQRYNVELNKDGWWYTTTPAK